jgi:hypothetical protein
MLKVCLKEKGLCKDKNRYMSVEQSFRVSWFRIEGPNAKRIYFPITCLFSKEC